MDRQEQRFSANSNTTRNGNNRRRTRNQKANAGWTNCCAVAGGIRRSRGTWDSLTSTDCCSANDRHAEADFGDGPKFRSSRSAYRRDSAPIRASGNATKRDCNSGGFAEGWRRRTFSHARRVCARQSVAGSWRFALTFIVNISPNE